MHPQFAKLTVKLRRSVKVKFWNAEIISEKLLFYRRKKKIYFILSLKLKTKGNYCHQQIKISIKRAIE